MTIPLVNHDILHGTSSEYLTPALTESLLDLVSEHLLLSVTDQSFLATAVTFLTLARATQKSSADFFADHFFGLPQCLRMTAPSIKRLLLDHQEDTALLKQWAVLAKKAKEYFESGECRLLHVLVESCFTKALFS